MDEHQHKRFGPLFAAGLAVTACLILYTQRDLSQYAWPIGQHRPPALSVQRWTLKFAGAQHLQLSSSFQAPEPELDWKQARSWLRDRIETLAAADNQTGWHGAVEPTRPRPQAAGHVRRLLRSAHERRRLSDGGTDSLAASAASAPTAAQRPDHPMSQPADTSASAAPAAAAAGGNALGVDAAAGVAAPMLPTALLAVPTANVWNKTELMVASLAAVNDGFELLVVDELSTDETVPKLREIGVHVIQPPSIVGVTYNWNMAYQYWKNSSHEYFFISNNDVLVPDGALTSLMRILRKNGPGCDLVAPLSTVHGKGYAKQEGIENVLKLSALASAWVNQVHNFGRVQAVLASVPAARDTLVIDMAKLHNGGFSGFFFGMRRGIDVAAYDADHGYLFDPKLRILGQESDLSKRMARKKMRLCLDVGSFVYHFKGSTISPVMTADRENFRAPG